jgi:hypothetical protein
MEMRKLHKETETFRIFDKEISMGMKEEYELDLQLGDLRAENKRLHEQLYDALRELAQLRREMESIHAISYKSLYHRQPKRIS